MRPLSPNIIGLSYAGILYRIDPLLFKELRQFLKRWAISFHRPVKNFVTAGPGEGPCVQADRQGH